MYYQLSKIERLNCVKKLLFKTANKILFLFASNFTIFRSSSTNCENVETKILALKIFQVKFEGKELDYSDTHSLSQSAPPREKKSSIEF